MVEDLEEIIQRLKKLEKEGKTNTQEAKELALQVYEYGLDQDRDYGHQSYWNDRFYVAVVFGLDIERQRESAVNSIVANGRSHYFEGITHHGFNTLELLLKMGVPLGDIAYLRIYDKEYTFLDQKVIEIITKKLGINLKDRKKIKHLQRRYNHSRGFRLVD